jgi:hypothetical protein
MTALVRERVVSGVFLADDVADDANQQARDAAYGISVLSRAAPQERTARGPKKHDRSG